MNLKQTMRNLVLGGLLIIPLISSLAAVQPVAAANSCGGVTTSIIKCDQDKENPDGDIENTGIWGLLILTINIMSAGVGVLALAGIVYGSIVYTTSGGNPEQAKKARGIIKNVVIGVIAYGAMFASLNFIVPGGVFN